MAKARVILCAQRQLGLRCAEFLLGRDDTEIGAIVSVPGDWQADLIGWAASRKLKVFAGNANLYLEEIGCLQPDFLFSVVYTPILKGPLLGTPALGCLNLHPGLLPRYGGCHPIPWSILNGESHAGATLHYMAEKVDAGDVLAQAAVPLGPATTAGQLHQQVTDAAFGLFKSVYPLLLSGQAGRCAQVSDEIRYYSRSSLDFAEGRMLAFDRPAVEVDRQARAFTFESFQVPGGRLALPDGRTVEVAITGTTPNPGAGEGSAPARPGTILRDLPGGAILVATAEGAIAIARMEGRPAAEYLRELGCGVHDAAFV